MRIIKLLSITTGDYAPHIGLDVTNPVIILVMLSLIAEKTQAETLVREAAHTTPTTTSPQRDVRPRQKQRLADQFQLLEAGGGKKDALIAVHVREKQRGLWILEGSRWVKQCDVPKDLPDDGVCFCAVTGGLLAMGGVINKQTSPVCYHYSLSERRWRKLPDMIIPRQSAKIVEISPMLVQVFGGDYQNCSYEILDIKQGKWSSVKPELYKSPQHAASTDGRVFIGEYRTVLVSQFGDYNEHYNVSEYHPSSGERTHVALDIHIFRRSPSSDPGDFDMAAVAGKLYLVGKINREYDITTQCVTKLPKPKARYTGCCATVRGKNILLCGSYGEEYRSTVMEEYNTATRQWKMLDVSLPFVFRRGQSFVANICI